LSARASGNEGCDCLPVTVKCRIGVDEQDPEDALDRLADSVLAAGADAIWVHARKAWLKGLSPKENRDVPPLDYSRVYRLKERLPDVFVGINGGITDLASAQGPPRSRGRRHDGRAAYGNPAILAGVDALLGSGDHSLDPGRGGGAHDPLCGGPLCGGRQDGVHRRAT
jgi:tRNA-dihydrouridine synthase A